jgi:hypothetical protein
MRQIIILFLGVHWRSLLLLFLNYLILISQLTTFETRNIINCSHDFTLNLSSVCSLRHGMGNGGPMSSDYTVLNAKVISVKH